MICVVCGKPADEWQPMVTIYVDIGKWEGDYENYYYIPFTTRALAVAHLECLKDCPNRRMLVQIHREMEEFKKENEPLLKRMLQRAKVIPLKVIQGKKKPKKK